MATMVREVVAAFDSAEALQAAVDALSLEGFERRALSVMADDRTIRDRLGWVPRRIEEAEGHPDVPRNAPAEPEELGDAQGVAIAVPAYLGAVIATGAVAATGGTILAAAAAAVMAGAGGGVAGSFLSAWLGGKHREPLRQHLGKGGILLWVNVAGEGDEAKAIKALSGHSILPPAVQEIPAASA
jgi:hypothetical protein